MLQTRTLNPPCYSPSHHSTPTRTAPAESTLLQSLTPLPFLADAGRGHKQGPVVQGAHPHDGGSHRPCTCLSGMVKGKRAARVHECQSCCSRVGCIGIRRENERCRRVDRDLGRVRRRAFVCVVHRSHLQRQQLGAGVVWGTGADRGSGVRAGWLWWVYAGEQQVCCDGERGE